ncbi:carbohydrate sulfotransferase 8-like [Sinocyclocheilus anshuiensis]|uniref:carbohydrate sulfotransferase 8-like n=1 Tax=Sinocyclocheilus anshuiensis TaxID=1608454 RepID=UPI0007B88FF1|nr:PREDICTED: carbohydrate sulfotransferase 8-like [Sinocyclocheilus anshuiensis]
MESCVKFRGTTQSRQEQCAQFSEVVGSVSARLGRVNQRSEEGDIDPISPMQLPDSQWKRQAATPGSREHDPSSQQVTKRHRKLLKTSPVRRPHTNSSHPPSSSSSSRRLSDIQESRRRIIREVCGKYRSNISRTITPHHVSRIYVEDHHKLLYCEVPKAGCSNWKRILMVLAGVANSTREINHVAVHYDNHLKRLDSFDHQGISKRLETYTKVLFIREPMERLVSAFRDKFESPNSYYHPVFGKPIISKYRILSDIQESRRRIIREVCGKYRSNISRTITPHHVSRIYVEDHHKLLYCEVPKAGCSNWKRILMVLAGVANSTREINHVAVHYDNHLKRLDSFDHQGISKRLETYTKVLFIREPMERLVSAFRDKFESPNSYYHPVFGKPIISKYRVNASQTALKTGSGVTFREFIHYLLDVHRPVGMDIHWEAANQLCSPCHLHYDFIGKVETLEEDANFLLRKIGAPENLTYPSFKDGNPKAARTSTQITQHYFSLLNASERQRAFDFYYMDYLMFNYSKPYKDLY